MSHSPSSPASGSASHGGQPESLRANWSGVLAMSLCVFALIASEFMPVSLLTPIAEELRVSEGLAGQGIAISGLFAVLTSLSITRIARGRDRRTVLLLLTVLMAASSAIVALAPSYLVYMIGRALIGVVIGGFWSLSAAIAMRLVPDHHVPRALAIFNGGNALAAVLAAPIGSYLGSLIGWRGAFLCLVPVSLIALAWQWISLPPMKAPTSAAASGNIFAALRATPVALGMAGCGLFFMGQFILFTTNRRVAGLRRSEVASLAGVSVEYYTRLERGAISGASPEVLDCLARALLLDDAERAHLFDLAHAASPVARPPRKRSPKGWTPHTSLHWALDAVTAGPAFVRNGRMDLLAANSLARAFYKDAFDMPGQPPNLARFIFLDPRGYDFHADWGSFADTTVAILRTEAGRDPHNKELHDLIGELGTRSEEFRTRWAAHHVRHHGTGFKTFRHPIVGEITVAFEGLEMASEPGLTLTIYTAEPGSDSAERMQLLASWAAGELGSAEPAEVEQSPRHCPKTLIL